jgi:carbon monoxide dehydrogenase subunit G
MATQITSNKVFIAASDQEVFNFLSDFNNVKELLPQDKISDWKASKDECSFKIQNAAVIPLVKDGTDEFTKINVVSGEKAPFPFTLEIYV